MGYKFLNGWKVFRIIARRGEGGDSPNTTETFNFTFRNGGLVESYEKQSIRREYLNGKKRKQVFYVNLRWDIDYTQHIEAEDLEKFARVENLESIGWELELIPHIDVKERKFKVQIIDERREYGLQYHHRGKKATAHKGYKIAFENTEPITMIEFVNMDTYIGNANVKINPIELKGN